MPAPYVLSARGPDGIDYVIEAFPRGMGDGPSWKAAMPVAGLIRHYVRYRGSWVVRVHDRDDLDAVPLGEVYASTGDQALEVAELLRAVILKRGYPRAPREGGERLMTSREA